MSKTLQSFQSILQHCELHHNVPYLFKFNEWINSDVNIIGFEQLDKHEQLFQWCLANGLNISYKEGINIIEITKISS